MREITIKLSDILAERYNKNYLVTYFYGVFHDVDVIKAPGGIGYMTIDANGVKTPISYTDMKNWYDENKYNFRF